jgi:hypothetical protein
MRNTPFSLGHDHSFFFKAETLSSIPPLMNHLQSSSKVRPLMEQQCTPSSSTPRRPASDSFDNNGGQSQRTTKRARNNDQLPRIEHLEQHHLPTLVPPHQQQNSFSINVLKHAVSNNLPCFFIIFDHSVDPNNIPSCTQVAIMLKKSFADNQLPIKELSMCIQAGERRFKFAVGDKADFLTLFKWNWPDVIENKKVEIIKPHSPPDCFALVVRYIPLDVNRESATHAIVKSIPAAVGFSSINYHHRQRPSYDLRFNVLNLEQYHTALELGRLAIGQHYLPITNFLTGYRLTYCTSCWKIGHMRNKCQSPVCCRKCLVPYINGVNHTCQGDTLNCAQCGGNHFSLDARCHIVKKYKDELKLAVDKALASGVIKRPVPGELSRPFQHLDSEFPVLNKAQILSRPAWFTSDNESLYSNLKKEMNELVGAIKTLSETMIRTENNFKELNNRIELQDKRTILHNNSLCAVVDTIQLLSKWVQGNSTEKQKLKKTINKSIENLQKWKHILDKNKSNDSSSSTTSPQPITTNNNIINNNNIGEVETNEDFSMNSQGEDV